MAGRIPRGFSLFEEVLTAAEESALLEQLTRHMHRKQYQRGHWDGVIFGFRESELPLGALGAGVARVIAQRLGDVALLPLAHVLDIDAGGRIDHHVDSERFMGGVVAPLSLGAAATLELRPRTDDDGARAVRVLVPPRSLYRMEGEARYEWSHAILPLEARRVSVVLRDVKEDADDPVARLMKELRDQELR